MDTESVDHGTTDEGRRGEIYQLVDVGQGVSLAWSDFLVMGRGERALDRLRRGNWGVGGERGLNPPLHSRPLSLALHSTRLKTSMFPQGGRSELPVTHSPSSPNQDLSPINTTVERRFLVNKECLVENLHQDSLIAQRVTYDSVTAAGGLLNMTISKQMIHAVRNPSGIRKEALEKKKKIEVDLTINTSDVKNKLSGEKTVTKKCKCLLDLRKKDKSRTDDNHIISDHGKAYAEELAMRGMNIALIGHTSHYLDEIAAELEQSYHIETIVIEVDFSKGSSVYDLISQAITNLDIGILVNDYVMVRHIVKKSQKSNSVMQG
uniref:Uncharacterized protein n=1 Tax=Timema cristinae TaxID=61476 RepID=A0A7R9CF02_TIMCR|nr:unnamed protein product [Timema cristinae]